MAFCVFPPACRMTLPLRMLHHLLPAYRTSPLTSSSVSCALHWLWPPWASGGGRARWWGMPSHAGHGPPWGGGGGGGGGAAAPPCGICSMPPGSPPWPRGGQEGGHPCSCWRCSCRRTPALLVFAHHVHEALLAPPPSAAGLAVAASCTNLG